MKKPVLAFIVTFVVGTAAATGAYRAPVSLLPARNARARAASRMLHRLDRAQFRRNASTQQKRQKARTRSFFVVVACITAMGMAMKPRQARHPSAAVPPHSRTHA